MKKEYAKPTITVVTLIADHPLARSTSFWDDYQYNNELIVSENALE